MKDCKTGGIEMLFSDSMNIKLNLDNPACLGKIFSDNTTRKIREELFK